MSGLPYYPRYPRDFLEGTVGMDLELKGAYGVLIDLIMMRGELGLPDDPHFISGHLGCGVRKWNIIRNKLLTGKGCPAGKPKISIENGVISNSRADKEKIIQRKYRGNQAEKASAPKKNKDLQKPRRTSEKITDTDISLGTDVPKQCASRRSFSAFWEVWPKKIGKAAAEKAWRKLSQPDRQAARDAAAMWFDRWRAAHPQASPIHASSYLNQRRWEDEESPHERPQASQSAAVRRSSVLDQALEDARREDAASGFGSGEVDVGPAGEPRMAGWPGSDDVVPLFPPGDGSSAGAFGDGGLAQGPLPLSATGR